MQKQIPMKSPAAMWTPAAQRKQVQHVKAYQMHRCQNLMTSQFLHFHLPRCNPKRSRCLQTIPTRRPQLRMYDSDMLLPVRLVYHVYETCQMQYMDVMHACPRELAKLLSSGKRICALQYACAETSGPGPDPAALNRFKKGSKRRRVGGPCTATQPDSAMGTSRLCAKEQPELPSQSAQNVPDSKLCQASARALEAHATGDIRSSEFPMDAEGTHAMRREIDNIVQVDQASLCAKSEVKVGHPESSAANSSVLVVSDPSRAKRDGRRARPRIQDPAFE